MEDLHKVVLAAQSYGGMAITWLNCFRRLLVRWEKKSPHYLTFLHFACALIALRATGVLG